jgi:hypothetical protein
MVRGDEHLGKATTSRLRRPFVRWVEEFRRQLERTSK